jgi:MoxR-like ATPase
MSTAETYAAIDAVRHRLRSHLRGKDEIIELALAAFLGRGHLLLEGPPGTGKTSLAKAMASALGGAFRRIQMTSDLLPSDVVGVMRLRPGAADFEFRKGPVFTHFLLADELNRTSPKTQSALLEAMAEGTATVDGVTYRLPDPFFVVATQNPLEFHGVYPLAESQLDRFMLQLLISTPDREKELEIYEVAARDAETHARAHEEPLVTIEQARALCDRAGEVHVEKTVLAYAAELTRATRERPEVTGGVSVRGGIQLIAAARGLALARGREFVTPREIADLAVPALAHRLCFAGGEPDTQRKREIVREIVETTRAPR